MKKVAGFLLLMAILSSPALAQQEKDSWSVFKQPPTKSRLELGGGVLFRSFSNLTPTGTPNNTRLDMLGFDTYADYRFLHWLSIGGDLSGSYHLSSENGNTQIYTVMLGPQIYPDNLTVTVSVGASLFDDRFGIAAQKPKRLVKMERFSNDALDPKFCHGDLLLQICSNTAETNIHALRDVIKNMPDLIALRWKLDGFLPPHTIKRAGKDTVRNLLGFKDGTANLDGRDNALMDRVVWVQPGSDEPAWAAGGSYQVVRIIRNLVERWDRTPLAEQQRIIGRDKMSGAPLGMNAEHDSPDYAGDPKGERISLDAHIRLANPRTKETDASLILRRGFNFSRGISASGQLDMGLLFVCFQSDLNAGFLTVQKRLNNEPLEEYIKPTGGGYFFVLPGAPDESAFLGQGLLGA